MKAFDETLNEAKKSYFDSEYKSEQLHLPSWPPTPTFSEEGRVVRSADGGWSTLGITLSP